MKVYSLLLAGGAAVSLAAAAAGAPAAAAAGLTAMGIVGVLNSSANPSTESESSAAASFAIPVSRVQARAKIAEIEKDKLAVKEGDEEDKRQVASQMVYLTHHQFKIASSAGLLDVLPTILIELKNACNAYNDAYHSPTMRSSPFYEFRDGTLLYTYYGKTSVID